VRQLLSHQAGFEGDVFTDTGRGADAIEKYVALLADLPQIFAPGAMFSYNNAGYVVLGRLVERMRDTTWADALMERIVTPLGLERVSPSPYEAILHRVAVGHLGPDDDGVATPAPLWAMAPSNAPAGSMLAMTARDLAGFARMQLADGLAPNGERVLSSASVEAMRTPLVDLPRLTAMGAAWGLGWEIDRTGDALLYGHDGNTIGQSSFLRIAPEGNVAVVLLTNGGDGMGLFHDIADPLLAALTGTGLPEQPAPPTDPVDVDIAPYLGVFANSTVEMEVSQDDAGRLWLEQRPAPSLAELGGEASRTELVAYGDDSLIMRDRMEGMHVVLAFLSPAADGRHSFVHVGRALARAR
jgi:CubicO group peptidase (beta-lactamase class C family)